MNDFESEWLSWAARCIAKDASESTRETLRCAFYSGAMTWERMMLRIRISNDAATAAKLIADLHVEMQDYVDELLRRFNVNTPRH